MGREGAVEAMGKTGNIIVFSESRAVVEVTEFSCGTDHHGVGYVFGIQAERFIFFAERDLHVESLLFIVFQYYTRFPAEIKGENIIYEKSCGKRLT